MNKPRQSVWWHLTNEYHLQPRHAQHHGDDAKVCYTCMEFVEVLYEARILKVRFRSKCYRCGFLALVTPTGLLWTHRGNGRGGRCGASGQNAPKPWTEVREE